MLRVYDEFLEDETITSLSHQAYRLHMSALIYCSRNLTDGVVTAKAVKVLQAILGFPQRRYILELVDAGVWVAVDGTDFRIRNYLEFNPDAATVKRERAKARERMRKMRDKRAAPEPAAGSPERAGERSPERYGERYGAGGSLQYQSSPVHAFGTALKAVPADDEKTLEVRKLLRHLKDTDEGTEGVLLSYARRLPLSSVAKVRESCETRRVGAGYAVNALQSELAEIAEQNGG
jgi:hypothetical protein